MNLTLEQSRKLKSAKALLLIGIILGPVYTFFSDGFSSIHPYINTITIGAIAASVVILFEFILFTGTLRKLQFYKVFVLRVVLYTLTIAGAILLVMIISRMFRYDLNFQAVLYSEEFQHYLWNEDFLIGNLYSLGVVAIVIFTLQMQRKIGPKKLLGFVSGKYNHPQEIERIVMFIEVQNVKPIIEKIGRVKFFQYLNDIIYGITDTILYRKGEIYEYVENKILLIWKINAGVSQANCIRTYFEIKERIEANKINYYEKYGFVPVLYASLHCGKVIRGVIGDVKSDVKYHGDVMNTTSRILDMTSTQTPFLISSKVMQLIELPTIYKKEKLGEVKLKGKVQRVKIFSLQESEISSL